MFKVGDKVTAYGLRGEVLNVTEPIYNKTFSDFNEVHVAFMESGFSQVFTSEGKADPRHKEPVLKLIVPEKKKVKKTLYVAVGNVPVHGSIRGAHDVSMGFPRAEDAYQQFAEPHQVVPLTIEIEE